MINIICIFSLQFPIGSSKHIENAIIRPVIIKRLLKLPSFPVMSLGAKSVIYWGQSIEKHPIQKPDKSLPTPNVKVLNIIVIMLANIVIKSAIISPFRFPIFSDNKPVAKAPKRAPKGISAEATGI
jgi:hypothetical protein